MTNKEKRRAVLACLRENPGKSDRFIAEKCGVSQPFVTGVRSFLASTDNAYKSTVRTGRDGRTIDTRKIGRKKAVTDKRYQSEEDEEEQQSSEDEAERMAYRAARMFEDAGREDRANRLRRALDDDDY